MTKHFLLTVLCGGLGLLAVSNKAQAQTDSTRTVKPQLNTAPPAPTAPQPRQQVPAAMPTEQVPQPPAPATGEQLPQPTQDSPSGLNLPPQPKVAEAPKSKYFLYSNFGLGFSSNAYYGSQFSFSVAPAVGYRITERLAVGPGLSYAYNHIAPPRGVQSPSFSTNSVGVKVFAQYIVYQQFFAHAEYEVTRAENLYQDNTGRVFTGKTTVNTPLLGAGYRQPFGERAAGDITLLYNFNDGLNDIYGQPVIRFSFLFDLK